MIKANTEQLKRQQSEIDDLRKYKAETEERDRKRRIEDKVKTCKVPAFRTVLSSMLDFASINAGKQVNFTQGEGDKAKVVQMGGEEVIDQLIAMINGRVATLFKESGETKGREAFDLGSDGDIDADSIKAQVDKQAKAYSAANKGGGYSAAVLAVLAADPELARTYKAATVVKTN